MTGPARYDSLCLCLTAGIAAGTLFLGVFPFPWVFTFIVSICLTIGCALSVRFRPDMGRLALLFLLTGLLCALSDGMSSHFAGHGGVAFAERFADRVKDTIGSIPYACSTTGGLVKGLLTGDRSGIAKEVRDVFRASGASHILALSGLHLGIIYSIILGLCTPLGNGRTARWIKYAATVLLCGFYAAAAGFGASITRAFLFILISETLKILGRPRRSMRVLLTALVIQLVANPSVISDTGFQLSYLAMTGITVLYPVLDSWYPSSGHDRADLPRRIWQAAALSISCQAFTGPLAWLRFHSFPKYFLLTNILAMPVTTAVMVTSVIVISLSAAGCCPGWMVAANEKTVSILLGILTVISEM